MYIVCGIDQDIRIGQTRRNEEGTANKRSNNENKKRKKNNENEF